VIAVGNGKSYAAECGLSDADLNDGLLDVMILNPVQKRIY